MVLFHFILPFLLLLSRDLKRNAKTPGADRGLALRDALARLLLAGGAFVLRWARGAEAAAGGHAAASALHGAAFHLSWLDPLAPIAIGGIWMWFFIRQLGKRTLLPIQDPYIREALNHD